MPFGPRRDVKDNAFNPDYPKFVVPDDGLVTVYFKPFNGLGAVWIKVDGTEKYRQSCPGHDEVLTVPVRRGETLEFNASNTVGESTRVECIAL